VHASKFEAIYERAILLGSKFERGVEEFLEKFIWVVIENIVSVFK
jgi:hypothetical protein